MNPFTIGILIFVLTFVVLLLLILKKERTLKIDNDSKRNIRIFRKILIAILLSVFFGIIGFFISTIILLGTDLSI